MYLLSDIDSTSLYTRGFYHLINALSFTKFIIKTIELTNLMPI